MLDQPLIFGTIGPCHVLPTEACAVLRLHALILNGDWSATQVHQSEITAQGCDSLEAEEALIDVAKNCSTVIGYT